MLELLKAWRRRHFPTASEQYENGQEYAKETFAQMKPYEAMYILGHCQRNYKDPFDKGILSVTRLYQNQYDAGWNVAKQVLKDAPRAIALQLIERKALVSTEHYVRGLMDAVNNKERRF